MALSSEILLRACSRGTMRDRAPSKQRNLQNQKKYRQGHGPNLLYKKMWPFPRSYPCLHEGLYLVSIRPQNQRLGLTLHETCKLEQGPVELHAADRRLVLRDLLITWMTKDDSPCASEQVNCQLELLTNRNVRTHLSGSHETKQGQPTLGCEISIVCNIPLIIRANPVTIRRQLDKLQTECCI